MQIFKPLCLMIFLFCLACNPEKSGTGEYGTTFPDRLFRYTEDLDPRWISFENTGGLKGRGGMENNGAKGHAFDKINAGESITLVDIEGPGVISRIWITINDRSPDMLRGLVINMYWDANDKPAVSVPFGDFFGTGLGRTAVFENALFANPEGRSFNCFIPMPFRTAARVEVVNELDRDLANIFFEINLQLLKKWDDSYLYFHSYWQRDTATTPGMDFEILPLISGKGRFLGTNVSVVANPDYEDCWWGEGEVKIYLNGDNEYPTLVGTGTEDYIGTAWGQGQFVNQYTGCLIADAENLQWAFYRYHIPDPLYFKTNCRVTIQQMGGKRKEKVAELQERGVDLIPVAIIESITKKQHQLYHKDHITDLKEPGLPDGWTNFFRSDDVAATAYFYLDEPVSDLPGIQSTEIRNIN